MNKTRKIIISLLLGFSLLISLSLVANAQVDTGIAEVGPSIGLPSTDIRLVAANIIRAALGLLGIVAFVLIVYGGYLWMTAGGNEEQTGRAKKILVNSAIGAAIILSSFAITSFIISRLVGATTVETGGGGGGGGGGEDPYLLPGIFYVDSLPGGGDLCIKNIHPAIVFNRAVDLASVGGNIVIQKEDGSQAVGAWQLGADNMAVFIPSGDCGDGGASDCFDSNSRYILKFLFPDSVKNSDKTLSLNCLLKAGCSDVMFKTGDGVDRSPPTIAIQTIPDNLLTAGSNIPVNVSYSDDNGLQNMILSADGNFVGSKSVAGCQKTGIITVNWSTAGLAGGEHALDATGYDWSLQGGADSMTINLKPQHCLDGVLQTDLSEEKVGPPDCGGECGSCAGGSCTGNNQCASGYCEIPAGGTQGACVDKAQITGFSPLSGAPGTLVSIYGKFFGEEPGHVFFGDKEASLASCGASSDSWKPWQIVAEAPAGASTAPIKIETAPDATGRVFTDATNDDYGPADHPNFEVTGQARPGLCGINPNRDVAPGIEVTLSGKNFGLASDNVLFGQVSAWPASWQDSSVKARAPFLETGYVAVKVVRSSVESNGVLISIKSTLEGETPIISSILPESGAEGEYITIIGKNFGSIKGLVAFKPTSGGEAFYGDFNFPPECKTVWSDTRVIVKFPKGKGTIGDGYFVQIKPADASLGWSPLGPVFKLTAGSPRPGICSIDPVSGPVPFGSAKMRIAGEYFGPAPSVYFWSPFADADSVDGRVSAAVSDLTNETVGQSLTTQPPAGTQTGPVIVYSANQISNPDDFTVLDCTKNNNTCADTGYHCCSAGAETGLCKPNGTLCEGEKLSAGYIWRFSTKEAPKVPHVVERCDNSGKLPSPSPSAQWDGISGDDHSNVCRSAAVIAEFSVSPVNAIKQADVIINKCAPDSANKDKRTCTVAEQVPVRDVGDIIPMASSPQTNFIELFPALSYNGGKWEDNTWYQVVLKTGISSGVGENLVNLAQDKPCDLNGDGDELNDGAAYCFLFRADSRGCKIKDVFVTPYNYLTSVLEAPVRARSSPSDAGTDLFYEGHGLSDQRCIIMDTSDYAWAWNTSDITKSNIFSISGVASKQAQVSALGNTVGIGLAGDAVGIRATASRGAINYSGQSPLKIDLTSPQVIDFWPKCQEACLNATVGAKFNTTMADKNLSVLSGGPVRLKKCIDENCLSTEDTVLSGASFSETSNYTELTVFPALSLEPNTIYKIELSASTTDLNSPKLLWSAAVFGNPHAPSKPYNQEYAWKFKTKGEVCKISKVDVQPALYLAKDIYDRAVFEVRAYASPDNCDPAGQKIDARDNNWNWSSSNPLVAELATFSTKGRNPFCAGNCLRKGSVLPLGSAAVAVCGNGKLEAGEDCDSPNLAKNCGLDCLNFGSASAPAIAFFDAENAGALTQIPADSVKTEADNKVYSAVGPKSLFSSDFIPVETVKHYRLSGKFKSMGAARSILFFGLAPFDANKNAIEAWDVMRRGNDATITDFTNTAITVSEVIDGWFGAGTMAHQRSMGFYYDGNTTKRPDYVYYWYNNCSYPPLPNQPLYCTDSSQGAYNGASINGSHTISLNNPIPDSVAANIVKGTTVVKNHYSGSTYIYSSAANATVLANWTEYAGTITGEAFGNDPNIFRPDTKYVKISFLLNHQQTAAEETWFDNISFAEVSTCGDGVLQDNEECDPADPATKIGCNEICLHAGSSQPVGASETSASVCGNGFLGSGEDCDLGVAGVVGDSRSSLNCSAGCLHLGTKLSASWCAANTAAYGGFASVSFKEACASPLSQCGDGITDPSEDPGCDLGGGAKADNCANNCLSKNECNPADEGCGADGQHLGSSLKYSAPSSCGDGAAGIGEDAFCETGLGAGAGFIDPWALAIGKGESDVVEGIPPAQKTSVSAGTSQNTVSGGTMSDSGDFKIVCGYTSNSQCQAKGPEWGLGADTCCHLKPLLTGVYPGSLAAVQPNICPNTQIEARFNRPIDKKSLENNVIVARGIRAADVCGAGEEDISSFMAKNASPENLPWYKKVFVKFEELIKKIIGNPANAFRADLVSSKWCGQPSLGVAKVVPDGSESKITFNLLKPLSTSTDYLVLLKSDIMDTSSVKIGNNISWKFITGEEICEVGNVSVSPANVYFDAVGATAALTAQAQTSAGRNIQPIPDYFDWKFKWSPENPYVTLENTASSQNTITAQNRNGEIDIRAAVSITVNKYTDQNGVVATGRSHAIVFLCENPWPPKNPLITPYEDKAGNNDGFNLSANLFDGSAIPASPKGGYFNFSAYYCADSGAHGTADDLPYLRPAVQVSSDVVISDAPTSSLKRFIFTNNKNNDAVGIQVFSNPAHLSVRDWFQKSVEEGGRGFAGVMQEAVIDGYPAITDGNNYYAEALNYAGPPSDKLYTNIYLFSISDDATAETKNVFDQMLKNIKFNTNLTNYGYCGTTMDNPGSATPCETDYECPSGEVCSVQIDKLKRNYQRLKDLQTIEGILGL